MFLIPFAWYLFLSHAAEFILLFKNGIINSFTITSLHFKMIEIGYIILNYYIQWQNEFI